jgi:hypothetical protein
VKFCTYTLIDNSPDPISGEQLTTYERFQHVGQLANPPADASDDWSADEVALG